MVVSLVIPVHNETALLPALLELVRPAALAGAEVVFVDDGSTDGTADALRAEPVVTVRLPERRGFGGAVKAGLTAASGDVVVWLPGNGRIHPLAALALGEELRRRDVEQTCFLKARRSNRPTGERIRTFAAGAAVSLFGCANLFENGGTPTALHRKHLPLVLDGPDDLTFELYTLWRLQRAGLRRLALAVPFGARIAGTSRWNRGFLSQLQLLQAQLRALRSWQRR
jgi:glycosyltransferase involved in cell wall biosynthesis